MTDIKIKGDGWGICIIIQSGVTKDIKKKLYELAEKALNIIPDKK